MKIFKVKFGEPSCNPALPELPFFIMDEENKIVFSACYNC